MNKQDRPGRRAYRSQQSRRLLVQYVASLALYAVGFVAFVYLAWQLCSRFTWYDGPVWQVLNWIREYIVAWTIFFVVAGWIAISYYFLSKPLRYLDEVVQASAQLAQPADAPIVLPPAMKSVQDELNFVREQALRSARAAKDAEQRKNDLIVYLAHDLKTPLTSVIGYLSLLRDEPQLSAELRARYTGIALEKAQRLEELINEFFEITRFNLTHLSLETTQIDLVRMLQQLTSEFAPIFQEKDLHCTLELPRSLQLECDPDKLARVFDNLLRNACNYSFGGSAIHIAAKVREQSVVLTFTNSGRTIPKEKLERIFDQFFRLDSSRSSASGGSGLGLAIAREIVRLHGGEIVAQSKQQTVTFTVILPLCQPS